MSVLATITFAGAMVSVVLWILAFGAKLAGQRMKLAGQKAVIFPSVASSGGTGQVIRELTLGACDFLFDRSMPAAAAALGSWRFARSSFATPDGAISVDLSSPSRREIEISVTSPAAGANQAIAAVRISDESSEHWILIPLSDSPSGPGKAGLALVPSTARAVVVGRDVGVIQVADIGSYSAADIGLSVRSATGSARRWWQALLDEAEAGNLPLPGHIVTAISTAISTH